jgi:hypothetical protein
MTPSEEQALCNKVVLLEAHVENLIERVFTLEEFAGALLLAIQSLENRLLAVERATPWQAPKPPAGRRPIF